ncbi:MAG TPA: class I SAM-dependent methyltransferase [Pirellulaceae bacterium]|nr:class I SAM-dependent methyltransferase [Pirellulaceae bacterium]
MTDHERILAAYFQLMNFNGAAHVYREAVRSGLLPALLGGAKSAAELAEECGTATKPTPLLLDVLVALGLAEKEGAQFRGTMLAFMLLSGSYKNLGDEYWSHLPELLRTGEPLVKMDEPGTSEAHYQSQAAALGWMLKAAAERAAALLAADLPPQSAILDVGAGSAIWSLTLARQKPDASVTAIDWPAVLAVADENAKAFGLQDRFTTIAGNYHEVPWPVGRFDLVILGNVTHLETTDGNLSLFRSARTALKPNGRLAIFDVFPGQPQGDLNRALYVLGLSLRTARGHVYSACELQPLLREAGFGESQLTPLDAHPYIVGMLAAR